MADINLKSEFEEIKEVKEKTLPEYYLAKAKYYAEQGKDVWIVDGLTGEKRYYNKVDEESRKIASALHKLGLRKGEVVIFMIKDLCKLHILFLGVWRANGVLRATYPDDDANTILSRVKENNVKFIFCEEEEVETVRNVAAKAQTHINIITTNRNDVGLLSLQKIIDENDGADCPSLDVTENDFALMLSTSGTTGTPKAAVHTHAGFLYQARLLERMPFCSDKPNLQSSRATHMSGAIIALAMLATGKTALFVSTVTPENIFKTIDKYKPGLAFIFPTYAIAMSGPEGVGYDFSSLETLLTGAQPITPEMITSFFKLPSLKDCIIWYGLTEFCMCTTSAILKEKHEPNRAISYRKLPDFSTGKLYPGTKLQIRDVETLKVLGPMEKDEICLKSPGLFHSYLNNPKATEEAYIDNYYRTGDVGYFDEQGFIYIVDRCKEIFKYYHNHISPTELENVISKHPLVLEACVVGVEDPYGCIPRAFVTVQPNSMAKMELEAEIKAFADAKLAAYKHLRAGVYVVDELPKGKTGKISRQLVQKIPIPY